jgi:hypothetical protein
MKNFHNENLLEALRTPAGGYDRRTIEMLGKQFPWVKWPPKTGWKKRIEESERDIVIPEDWNEQLESEQHFLAKVDAILDAVNRIEKRVMQEAENPENVIEQIKRKVEALIPTTGMTLVEASAHVNALYAVLDIIKEYESPIN